VTVHIAPGPTPLETRSIIYFPFIGTAPTPTVTGLTPTAAAFLRLLLDDERQEHPSLTVCASLILSATRRAEGLATVDPWSHCDSANICANAYAIAAGRALPDWYAPNGNQVESLCGGTSSAQAVFDTLSASPRHAAHLFGLNDFFRAQTHIGIACVENIESPYRWYWTIHIAQCGQVSGE
jgi:hypothetical protein